MVNVLYQIVYQIIIVSYLYCELDSHGYWVYCWLSILFHWYYWFSSLLCLSIPPFPQAHSLCLGCDSLSQWTLLSEVSPLFFLPLKSLVHVLLPCLPPPATVPSSEILLGLQRFLMKCPANLLPSLYLQVDRDGFRDMRSLLPSESWGRSGWALQGANFRSSWAHRPTHCFLWPSV